MNAPIGVAVIGAGMAGRAHAAAYRTATTLYDPVLPEIRLVAIADINPEFAASAARRFGYERAETDWRAIAAAEDIQVVSVVVANSLHREVVEGLLAAGKHVLCEKPLSDSLESARAMADAARNASTVARIGFTYRRMPAIAAIRNMILDGTLGQVRHFSGRYWCDYSCDPKAPMSWRYEGEPGTGALGDVGSHLSYVSEFLCGDIQSVSGGRFATAITQRPLPLAAVQGHDHVEVSDDYRDVTNDDYAGFMAQFENGSGALEVSRVAAGHPNGLAFEVFCENGAARYSQERPGEFELYLNDAPYGRNGYRVVHAGPDHPYFSGGLPMDATGVGVGQNDAFVFQARAFLEEVAGIHEDQALPRNASFDEGVRNMVLLGAVAESAARDGAAVTIDKEETR
ncbi:Gfo/Idh/MocA family protein [Propionibacteriaceae bacterium G57]|uniref:Gfo/Idh/MocA family protein n=1 Tax=Aestuariimicrobium sp. G57 TaxID=3418485 RepID=UPI003DA6ED92